MFDRIQASIATLLGSRSNGYWFGITRDAIDTKTVDPSIIRRATIVNNCIIRICDQISSLSWSCENKEINRILNDPNTLQTRRNFFYAITFDLLLYGVCYIWRVNKGVRGLEQAAPFEPEEVDEFWRNKKLYYKVAPREGAWSSPTGEIPGDHMIRIYDIPNSGGKGRSRISMCTESIRVGLDIVEAVRDLASNGPVLGAYLTKPGKVSDPDAEKWGKQLEQSFGPKRFDGGGNQIAGKKRGGVAVFGDGGELKPFGHALRIDPETVDFYHSEDVKIAATFGVPSFLVGAHSQADTTYNNYTAQLNAYNRDIIFPFSYNISESLSRAYGKEVKPDLTKLIAGDLASAVSISAEAFLSGIWSLAQAKKLTGQPIEDGDDKIYNSNPTSTRRSDEGLDPNRRRAGQDDFKTDNGNMATIPKEA